MHGIKLNTCIFKNGPTVWNILYPTIPINALNSGTWTRNSTVSNWIRASWSVINRVPRNLMCLKHPNTFQRIESYKFKLSTSKFSLPLLLNTCILKHDKHGPTEFNVSETAKYFSTHWIYKLDQEISEAINSPQVNFPSHSSLPFTCDTHSLWLCLLSPSLLPTILQLLLRGFHKLPIQTTSARILCLVLTNWALPMITHCLSL